MLAVILAVLVIRQSPRLHCGLDARPLHCGLDARPHSSGLCTCIRGLLLRIYEAVRRGL